MYMNHLIVYLEVLFNLWLNLDNRDKNALLFVLLLVVEID
jgi:hypothetical protein